MSETALAGRGAGGKLLHWISNKSKSKPKNFNVSQRRVVTLDNKQAPRLGGGDGGTLGGGWGGVDAGMWPRSIPAHRQSVSCCKSL